MLSTMLIYITAFTLFLIAILFLVIKPGKKATSARPHQEPFVGKESATAADETETLNDEVTLTGTEEGWVKTGVDEGVLVRTRTTTVTTPQATASYEEIAVETIEEEEAATLEEPVEEPVAKPAKLGLVVMHLVASPDRPYRGYELLQLLLALGLRYGKWNIFHRHEAASGRGNILFSLASSTEPGTFNLADISHFSSTGLTLFMRTQDIADKAGALRIMLHTADQITTELGGTVCDEQRQPLTREKVAQWQQAMLH